MSRFCPLLLTVLLFPIFCIAGSVMLPQECFKAMLNVQHFRKLHSETNLSPAIVSACAAGTSKLRLIWAVTDGKYYVVHQEYVPVGFTHTNFLILVAIVSKTNSVQPEIREADYMRSFKNYPTFVSQMQGPFLGNGD